MGPYVSEGAAAHTRAQGGDRVVRLAAKKEGERCYRLACAGAKHGGRETQPTCCHGSDGAGVLRGHVSTLSSARVRARRPNQRKQPACSARWENGHTRKGEAEKGRARERDGRDGAVDGGGVTRARPPSARATAASCRALRQLAGETVHEQDRARAAGWRGGRRKRDKTWDRGDSDGDGVCRCARRAHVR